MHSNFPSKTLRNKKRRDSTEKAMIEWNIVVNKRFILIVLNFKGSKNDFFPLTRAKWVVIKRSGKCEVIVVKLLVSLGKWNVNLASIFDISMCTSSIALWVLLFLLAMLFIVFAVKANFQIIIYWLFPKCFHWTLWIQWQRYVSLKVLKLGTHLLCKRLEC